MDQILNAVVTVICLVITGILIPLIKAKIGQEKFNQIRQYTEIAVRSAEQLYTPEEWKEKKQYVYDYILRKVNELGIGLDEADIDLIVEGIVNQVKHGRGD